MAEHIHTNGDEKDEDLKKIAEVEIEIKAPAQSSEQRNLMRMALGVKTGKLKLAELPTRLREKVRDAAYSMTEQQLKDFTK